MISSTSRMRRLARHRWNRNSGSWSELRSLGGSFPASVVEHPTQGNPIHVSALNAETDDSSSEDINDNHHPKALEQDGFTSKEVNAPEAVFGMTDGCQPRNSLAVGIGVVVLCKDATNHVLINVDTVGVCDLLGDFAAAPARFAFLHFHDGSDNVFGRALGTRSTTTKGRIEPPILTTNQCLMTALGQSPP